MKFEMDHKLISQLTPGHANFKIEVRVARLWESTNPRIKDKLFSLDVVLIDEKASAIQATMRAEDSTFFKEILKEGDIYLISNFVIAPTKQNFRAVPNEKILRFDRMTSITKIKGSVQIPAHTFSFIAFAKLPDRVHKDVLLTDVIGRIISVGHIEVAYTKDGPTNKKNLHIEDLSGDKVQITLWGKIAEDFPENLILEQKNNVVIIFAGMTVRIFNQNICVCSCSATKIYFDTCIPEIVDFQRSLPNFSGVTPILIEEEKPVLSPEQQANNNRKSVLQLQRLLADDNEVENTIYTCQATVMDIDASERWWYLACPSPKCKAGLTKFEDRFWCNKCTILQNSSMAWYKVNFVVKDETGEISFIAFGNVIADLVGVPASSFSNDPLYKDGLKLPPVLLNLVGKTYTFKVAPGFRNFRKNASMKVVKILKDYIFDNHSSENASSSTAGLKEVKIEEDKNVHHQGTEGKKLIAQDDSIENLSSNKRKSPEDVLEKNDAMMSAEKKVKD